MAFHDLRGFLAHLDARGELRCDEEAVDPVLESPALCQHVLRADGPALLMTNAVGSPHPPLGNLFGCRRRIEAVLAGRPLAWWRELGEVLAAVKEPRWPGGLRDALASGVWSRR